MQENNELSDAGVNQYGQVVFANASGGANDDLFIPPEYWGPFSAPVDLLIGAEAENVANAAAVKIRFWKTAAIVTASATVILGAMFILVKYRDKIYG